ncbi:MAG: RES family NAD+ phosphorylase [Acidobacteriaceae bacterium]
MAQQSKIPPSRELQLNDAHRLIPSKFSAAGTVLARLTDDAFELKDLAELDGATNTRLLGEEGLLPGIGVHELVYGIRYAHIVNAAFTHAAPGGGRFNDSNRGAWYASLELKTSAAEVAFHRLQQLEEIDWTEEEISTFDDYLADFLTDFHELIGSKTQQKYLKPFPVPACYREPQQLAASLLAKRSNGIIYPSVRRTGGTCLVCFRPALVYHVRQAARFELALLAGRPFAASQMHEVKLAVPL